MLIHAPSDKAGQSALAQMEQRSVALVCREQKGGESILCDVGFDGTASGTKAHIPPVAGGREKENLGVLQPGDELLSAPGGMTPGLVGETDDLLQNGPPVKTPCTLAWGGESGYNESI